MTTYALVGEVAFPAYAWPGGYPLVYVTDDADVLCADCVNREPAVHFFGNADGWRIEGVDVHWEGDDEVCAHCSALIPSAYGHDGTD